MLALFGLRQNSFCGGLLDNIANVPPQRGLAAKHQVAPVYLLHLLM